MSVKAAVSGNRHPGCTVSAGYATVPHGSLVQIALTVTLIPVRIAAEELGRRFDLEHEGRAIDQFVVFG